MEQDGIPEDAKAAVLDMDAAVARVVEEGARAKEKQMIYFVIPARGGSKVIPGKNLINLGDVPLIQWTIETALEVAGSEYPVVVTSDNEKILSVSEVCGAEAYRRPAHLADDQSTMKDVVKDFFRKHADCTTIVLLYPTVPFRKAETIKAAISTFNDAEPLHSEAFASRSLMSVHESKNRPYGGIGIANSKFVYDELNEAYYRKQDTPPMYYANGAIYIIDRGAVEGLNTQLFAKDTIPFIIGGHESLDIDTPLDLELARALVDSGTIKPGDWKSAMEFEKKEVAA